MKTTDMNSNLASIKHIGKAWQFVGKGKHRQALQYAHKAVELNPVNPAYLHALTLMFLITKQMDMAEHSLIVLIMVYPHLDVAWKDYGLLLRNMDRDKDYETLMMHLGKKAPYHTSLRMEFAKYLITRSRHNEAETVLHDVLEREPQSAEAHFQLGMICVHRKRYHWATKEFEVTLQADENYIDAHLELVKIDLESGMSERALTRLNGITDDFKHSFDVVALWANALLDSGEEEAAHQLINEIVVKSPEDVLPLIELASIQAEIGLSSEALKHLRSAEENADRIEHLMMIAEVYEEIDTMKGARRCYENVLRANPSFPSGYVALANTYNIEGDLENAIRIMKYGLELAPQNAEFQHQMGNMLADQGEFTMAREHYEKAIDCDPEYLDAYMTLGIMMLEQAGMPEQALEVFEAGMIWGDNEQLRSVYVEALRETGRLDDAELVLRDMLRIESTSAGVLVQLGTILLESRRYQEARACFERSLELDPEWSIPYHGLGCCMWEDGERDLGLDYLRLAATLGSEPSIEFLQDLGEWNGEGLSSESG